MLKGLLPFAAILESWGLVESVRIAVSGVDLLLAPSPKKQKKSPREKNTKIQ